MMKNGWGGEVRRMDEGKRRLGFQGL